jgi:hypothetical protein
MKCGDATALFSNRMDHSERRRAAAKGRTIRVLHVWKLLPSIMRGSFNHSLEHTHCCPHAISWPHTPQ